MRIRNLVILFMAQCFSASGVFVAVMLGPIVGEDLAPVASLATLPTSLMVVGTAAAAVPAALFMNRYGRRLGFSLAAVLAVAAAGTAVVMLQQRSFTGFCVTSVMIGVNLAFVQQYRFAAAESVEPRQVSVAVSLVLLGSIGGAFLGPVIATTGTDLMSGSRFGGAYAIVAAFWLAAAALLPALRENRDDDHRTVSAANGRALRDVVKQPVFVVAVLGGVVGYGVMTLIMTATPLSMHVMEGHSLADTARVMRGHVVAMYLPSIASGFLIGRFGVLRMMLTGLVCLVATVLIAVQGREFLHYWWALVILGVGWNFLYVGGTTLLTRTYRGRERFGAQAVNEFSVFGMSATASLLAGVLIHALGWNVLNLTAVPFLVVMAVALWVVRSDARVSRHWRPDE